MNKIPKFEDNILYDERELESKDKSKTRRYKTEEVRDMKTRADPTARRELVGAASSRVIDPV